jgi:hypothetical protein
MVKENTSALEEVHPSGHLLISTNYDALLAVL